MTEWEESTAKGSIAAPAGGQQGTAMPPSGPRGAGLGRGVLVIALVILLALGGGAYLLARSRSHKPAPVNQVAAVRQAYLAWWNARVQEYLTSNPALVKPYMTAAGYQQEKTLFGLTNRGPFQLVAKHNLQAVVYSDAVDASIDDVWLSTSSSLDPNTHQPVGSPSDLTAEDSISLKKIGGRWLIDDVVRFGASQAVPGIQLSYAAADGGSLPPQPVRGEIEAAFARYRRVTAEAYLTLSPSLLDEVESGAALQTDQTYLDSQRSKGQPIRYADEDNYRIAMTSDTQAWIYDTVLDRSVAVSPSTGQPTEPAIPTVLRATYQLNRGAHGWLVTLDISN